MLVFFNLNLEISDFKGHASYLVMPLNKVGGLYKIHKYIKKHQNQSSQCS